MSKKKVYECDYCGTMLEEGDDYRNVLAKLGTGLIVSLRFCCPECVKKYAQEHSDGSVFNLPIMMTIDHIPGLTNHDFLEWRYLEPKDVMRYLNNNLGPSMEKALNESDEDYDEDIEEALDRATEDLYDFDSRSDLESDEDEYDDWWEEDDGEWEEEEPGGSSGYEE